MKFWLLVLSAVLFTILPVSAQRVDESGKVQLVERKLVGYFYVVKTLSLHDVVPGMQKVFARREFKGGKSGGGHTEIALAPASEKFEVGEQVEFVAVSYIMGLYMEMSAPARFARKKPTNTH